MLVDIVPNHVGVATPELSVWWWDVLLRGPESEHAAAFDIDWDFGGGKVRLPMLGDGDDELDAAAGRRTASCATTTTDSRSRRAPATARRAQVHDRQHYELMNYRRADAELNYRRFFAISTLAGIRVELPEVFAAVARRRSAGGWTSGWVDGLRIDHPDGLADPGGYLDDLAALIDHRYVLVEKIIEGDETLPASWACAGTTGYEALAALDRLFTDPAGEAALDELDTQLRGGLRVDWPAMTRSTKRAVADGILRSEVLRLARLVPGRGGRRRRRRTRSPSCSARSACTGPTCRSAAEYLAEAVDRAVADRPELEPVAARDRRPARRCRVRVLGAVPADLRHGDGQGRRGLRVLPLDQADLADRGRRRAGAVLAVARPSCTTSRADRLGRSPAP